MPSRELTGSKNERKEGRGVMKRRGLLEKCRFTNDVGGDSWWPVSTPYDFHPHLQTLSAKRGAKPGKSRKDTGLDLTI